MSSTPSTGSAVVQAEFIKLEKQVADIKLIKQGKFKETVDVKSIYRVICQIFNSTAFKPLSM